MNISDIMDQIRNRTSESTRMEQLLNMQKFQTSQLEKSYAGLARTPGLNHLIMQEREHKPLSEVLDEITMFRYGYVPFVIAELAWDYADTVVNMAIICGYAQTKKLCRAVRELRREYERYHDKVVSSDGKECESDNMMVFEDAVKDIFNLYITNVKCDLIREYHNIDENTLHFLVSIYQCLIVIKSLLRYSAEQTKKAEKVAGYHVEDVMPREIRSLETIIAAFIGDMPVSDRFIKEQETYIKTFATQIALIELNITNNED